MSKRNTKLAGRYASALQKAVQEAGAAVGSVAEELAQLAALWDSNEVFASSLINPLFSKAERKASLRKIMQAMSLSSIVERFVLVVFDRERIEALPEISEVFTQRVEQAAGLSRVRVRVARQLDEAERAEIEQSLKQQLEGHVEYEWIVEPEILGGLIVEYSGRVLDGSVSGRLQRLERQLLG